MDINNLDEEQMLELQKQFEENRKQKELNKIKNYVESAKKMVNVDEIIEAMTILNQKPSQEVVSLMKEYTDLLSSFTNKIKTINMLHLANPNSGFAKSKLDYIIFTENGPLVP